MMTVRELINELEALVDYDESNADKEVAIGMYQTYGCNFTYSISHIESDKCVENFWREKSGDYILLIEGCQFGVINGDWEEEDEE